MQFEQQTFLLQIAERLAHGDAAHSESAAQFVFGRHLRMRRIRAVENALAQRVLDLRVQRKRGDRGGSSVGAQRYESRFRHRSNLL